MFTAFLLPVSTPLALHLSAHVGSTVVPRCNKALQFYGFFSVQFCIVFCVLIGHRQLSINLLHPMSPVQYSMRTENRFGMAP